MNAQNLRAQYLSDEVVHSAGTSDIFKVIASLSDSDLAALEDELDFFAFTGVPSDRMLQIMEQSGRLDDAWRCFVAQDYRDVIPTVIKFRPMASHRRAQSRRLPLQALPALPEIA